VKITLQDLGKQCLGCGYLGHLNDLSPSMANRTEVAEYEKPPLNHLKNGFKFCWLPGAASNSGGRCKAKKAATSIKKADGGVTDFHREYISELGG